MNSKQDEATKFKVGPYALYKSKKAHVTGINIPDDQFEDIIYAISNRKEKSKHVTNDMLSLSTLIQWNTSITPFIPDNISFTTSPPSLQGVFIQSNFRFFASIIHTIDSKIVKK